MQTLATKLYHRKNGTHAMSITGEVLGGVTIPLRGISKKQARLMYHHVRIAIGLVAGCEVKDSATEDLFDAEKFRRKKGEVK